MPNGFASYAVLLAREGEGHKGGVVKRDGPQGIPRIGMRPESNIADPEKVVSAPRDAGVFTRAEKEEEGKGGAVSCG